MSIALSKHMNYSLKPTSVRATRKTLVIPSSNKTEFSPSDTCILYLPSLKNHVCDGQSAVLRFTATISTGNAYIDNNAGSFINRIQTYGPGGQLISDIQQYNVLNAMFLDLQVSASEKLGLSQMLGTEDEVLTKTAGAIANTAAITAAELEALLPDVNRRGMYVAQNGSYTFTIPLIHPIVGTMAEKYFPSYACSDDVRIEITWSTAIEALVGTASFTIKNPELMVDYIELDSSVIGLIQQTYSGRDLIIPAQDYRHYSTVIASGTSTSVSQIIPAKQQSARAFFVCIRPAETIASAGYAVSSRVCPFYSVGDFFRLNIGGTPVPAHSIRTRIASNLAEYFASTQSALHSVNSLQMNGCVPRKYYQAVTTQGGHQAGATSYQNGFALGINLDTLRGQGETQNSGVNLSGVTTYWEGYLTTASKNTSNANENLTVDGYMLFDILFVIDQLGLCSVRF